MTEYETTTQEVFIIEDGVEVPESPLLRVERDSGYGSVPGLEDEELASPAELEWLVFKADWGPILALPCRSEKGGIRPTVDESGNLDWGAFGTWDYERLRGPFDKARYKADKLQEPLQWALIMLGMVRDRLPVPARLDVVARVKAGADLDNFDDLDEHAFARWYERARNLRRQIRELRAASWHRRYGGQDA